MSSRPCSMVRKPSMWSNDRFSIIRTTTWSILRRFRSASVTTAPRSRDGELQIHPGLLVARDRAVDVVRAGLEIDVESRRLAGTDGRRLLVDAVALDHEVVVDLAVVLHVEAVRAGFDRRARERDLELGLGRGHVRRRLRRGGRRGLRGRRLRRGLLARRLV